MAMLKRERLFCNSNNSVADKNFTALKGRNILPQGEALRIHL
jgi:hypothetical protein